MSFGGEASSYSYDVVKGNLKCISTIPVSWKFLHMCVGFFAAMNKFQPRSQLIYHEEGIFNLSQDNYDYCP